MSAQSAPEPFVTLFEQIARDGRLYRALLGKRGSSWFATNMRATLTETLTERFQPLANELGNKQLAESRVLEDGFVAATLAAQLVAAIIWWLDQRRPYTPREVATCWFLLMCSTLKDLPAWAPLAP
jgi:hypothetical protein